MANERVPSALKTGRTFGPHVVRSTNGCTWHWHVDLALAFGTGTRH